MPKTNWSKTDRLPLALRFGVAIRLMDRTGYEAIRDWLRSQGVDLADLPSDDALRGYTEDPEFHAFANRKIDALADDAWGRNAARRAREAQPAEGATELGIVSMRVLLQQMRDAEDAADEFQRIAHQADRAELRLLMRLQAAVDAGVNILPPTDPDAELEAFQKMASWALSPRCREPMMLAAARLPDADPNAIAMAGFWMDRRDALARDPRVLRPTATLRLVGRAVSLMTQVRKAEEAAAAESAGAAGQGGASTPSISAITGLSPTTLWAMGKHAPKTREEAMGMAKESPNNGSQWVDPATALDAWNANPTDPAAIAGLTAIRLDPTAFGSVAAPVASAAAAAGADASTGSASRPAAVAGATASPSQASAAPTVAAPAPAAPSAPMPTATPAPAQGRPAPAAASVPSPAVAPTIGPIVATTNDELVVGLFDTIGGLMAMMPPDAAAAMLRESAREFGASEEMAEAAAARVMAGPLDGASLASLWDGMALPGLAPGAAGATLARQASASGSGDAAAGAASAAAEAGEGDSRGLPPHSRGLSGDSRDLPGDPVNATAAASAQPDPWAAIPGLGEAGEEAPW